MGLRTDISEGMSQSEASSSLFSQSSSQIVKCNLHSRNWERKQHRVAPHSRASLQGPDSTGGAEAWGRRVSISGGGEHRQRVASAVVGERLGHLGGG